MRIALLTQTVENTDSKVMEAINYKIVKSNKNSKVKRNFKICNNSLDHISYIKYSSVIERTKTCR